MSQHQSPPNQPNNEDPHWLEDIQELANKLLGSLEDGSACDQVHPVIARWYDSIQAEMAEMEDESLEDRPSVWQAVSCLATEIMHDAEADESLAAMFDVVDEDMIGMWVEYILMVGRAMETSLHNGDLDDL
jgi:hypothetical protein